MSTVFFVVNFRPTSTYALSAVAGAAMQEVPTARVVLAASSPSVAAAIRVASARGGRVVVGWSFYSTEAARVARELADVRARSEGSGALHVAGGPHATAEPEETLRSGFDLAVVGEGEATIGAILRDVAGGGEAHGIPGTARLVDGRHLVHAARERVPLDAYPPFAPGLGKFSAIEITRGCVYACRFCQTPFASKAVFRHRSVDRIAHWGSVMRAAGKRDFRFITPTALSYGAAGTEVRLDRIEELFVTMRRAVGPDARIFFGTFPSELRPEHVTAEALALLRRHVANDNLILGGQSGSDAMLARSHRGHDAACIARAARLCAEAGFRANVDLIFGLPGETEVDARQTIDLARRLVALGARVHGHTFMPLPGTPWKDAPAAALSPETIAALEDMAGRAQIYGQWKGQAAIAQALASRDRAGGPAAG
ncbi:MAG: TIGR04013 family B12-binding domain/radical SAM domain-containing protein [Acidobacteriota bacterium]